MGMFVVDYISGPQVGDPLGGVIEAEEYNQFQGDETCMTMKMSFLMHTPGNGVWLSTSHGLLQN